MSLLMAFRLYLDGTAVGIRKEKGLERGHMLYQESYTGFQLNFSIVLK